MTNDWVIKVDKREPKDMRKLFTMMCPDEYNVSVEHMTCGDYALYYKQIPVAGIERKRVDDLFNSIKDNRVFKQADLMIDYYDINYLAITKNLEDYIFKSEMTMSNIMGTLGSLVVRRDINLLWFQEEDHFVHAVIKIFEKIMEGKYDDVNVVRRDSDFIDSDYYNLIKIGWMNKDMAKTLLDEFDNIEDIYNAPDDELKDIRGIGDKRVEELKQILEERCEG